MAFYVGKYLGVEQKEYDVEIITPMFLAGADKNKAELRVPSIKGMLRFWWRATCGIDDIEEMKKLEDEIFGSTDKKASFSILIKDFLTSTLIFDEYKKNASNFTVHEKKISILDYLAYGTYDYEKGKGNVYKKEHIKPTVKFKVTVNFYEKKYQQNIINAFTLLSYLSGLGAKTRNGFGSIFIQNIDNIYIKDFFKGNIKNYTSFSEKSKIFEYNEYDKWEKALSEIGLAYRKARTELEHHKYDKRKLISAPLQVKKENKANLERHAKPYFLKVRKLSNGKFQGFILYLPYKHKDFENYLNVCKELNEKLSGGVR